MTEHEKTGTARWAPSAHEPAQASPKERRKDRLRRLQQESILDAAEVIFVRDGYHAAKVSDIAEEAGFSAGSLYTYFAGKEEIFQHMIATRFGELYERLEGELEEPGDFVPLIERLAGIFAEFMEKRRSFMRVIHSAYPVQTVGPFTQIPDVAQKSYAMFYALLERVIQKGIDDQALRDLPARELAAIFLGMVDSINQLWLAEEPPRPFSEIVPMVLDVLFNGVKR